MQNALFHADGRRYRLLAWCVMPNHVHVLIKPLVALPLIVRTWKSYTGHWALAHNEELGLGVAGGVFWMSDVWDRFMRDEKHLRTTLVYIHENPAKARLCKRPEDWRWSSAYVGAVRGGSPAFPGR
ncbi:MAG: transposase [Verrucomicrobiales bacterium]|nr:transposase [Verrucomicrobiales bacterium]